MSTVSVRRLNRTALHRQLLDVPTSRTAQEVIEHLVAMQAQEPNAPYVGLWTRMANFQHDDLTSLLHSRSVVRGAHLRTTQHLSSGEDFRWLRPLLQPVLDRAPRQGFGKQIAGLDLADLVGAARELLADQVMTRPQLGRLLTNRFPDRDAAALAGTAHFLLALLHPPPSGTWGHGGQVPCVLAETWLGQPLVGRPRIETMAYRYLAAFGPASVKDLQAWSGLTRLREVLDGLRSRLVTYRADDGTELFDLPDAVLVDEDQPAVVRFLPAFDNLLLGYADRSRVIHAGDRTRVAPGRSVVHPTFLVDGFVHGTWSMRGSALTITPLRPLGKADAAAVDAEADRLVAFHLTPAGRSRMARIAV